MSDWRNTKEEPKEISFYTSENGKIKKRIQVTADDEYNRTMETHSVGGV